MLILYIFCIIYNITWSFTRTQKQNSLSIATDFIFEKTLALNQRVLKKNKSTDKINERNLAMFRRKFVLF